MSLKSVPAVLEINHVDRWAWPHPYAFSSCKELSLIARNENQWIHVLSHSQRNFTKWQPLTMIQSHFNLVHILSIYFAKIHFNTILWTSQSSKWPLCTPICIYGTYLSRHEECWTGGGLLHYNISILYFFAFGSICIQTQGIWRNGSVIKNAPWIAVHKSVRFYAIKWKTQSL